MAGTNHADGLMNADSYLKERLEDQLRWYSNKSRWNKRWSQSLSIVQISLGALIPFFSGYMEQLPVLKYVVGLLGACIAIAAGLGAIFKFQDRWIEYRTTCETLKHEKYRYLTESPPYDGEDAFRMLVERTESLISQQNTKWAQISRQAKGAAKA